MGPNPRINAQRTFRFCAIEQMISQVRSWVDAGSDSLGTEGSILGPGRVLGSLGGVLGGLVGVLGRFWALLGEVLGGS